MNKNDESERNGFVWPVILKNPNAHANVDFYYGPYDSLDSLKEGVPNDLWVPGFTAAVQDENGVVTEWWVQGEGASAHWEQKGVRHDTYVALKGVLHSMAELEAIEKPEVGDMYLVPEEGETGSFLEYVYTGDKWELLGRNSGKTRGVLTMIESDGTKKFNGYTDMSVDLSKYAKKSEILKPSLSFMYMDPGEGYSYYYDNDGLKQYSGLTMMRYTDDHPSSDGSRFAVEIGPVKDYFNIIVTLNGAYYRYGRWKRWRLNPLVLAVRISHDADGNLTTEPLYDPYGLERVGLSTTVEYQRYTLTHHLKTSGIVKGIGTYSVMGSVEAQPLFPTSAFMSFVVKSPDTVDFFLSSGSTETEVVEFAECDLFFYDFTVY